MKAAAISCTRRTSVNLGVLRAALILVLAVIGALAVVAGAARNHQAMVWSQAAGSLAGRQLSMVDPRQDLVGCQKYRMKFGGALSVTDNSLVNMYPAKAEMTGVKEICPCQVGTFETGKTGKRAAAQQSCASPEMTALMDEADKICSQCKDAENKQKNKRDRDWYFPSEKLACLLGFIYTYHTPGQLGAPMGDADLAQCLMATSPTWTEMVKAKKSKSIVVTYEPGKSLDPQMASLKLTLIGKDRPKKADQTGTTDSALVDKLEKEVKNDQKLVKKIEAKEKQEEKLVKQLETKLDKDAKIVADLKASQGGTTSSNPGSTTTANTNTGPTTTTNTNTGSATTGGNTGGGGNTATEREPRMGKYTPKDTSATGGNTGGGGNTGTEREPRLGKYTPKDTSNEPKPKNFEDDDGDDEQGYGNKAQRSRFEGDDDEQGYGSRVHQARFDDDDNDEQGYGSRVHRARFDDDDDDEQGYGSRVHRARFSVDDDDDDDK